MKFRLILLFGIVVTTNQNKTMRRRLGLAKSDSVSVASRHDLSRDFPKMAPGESSHHDKFCRNNVAANKKNQVCLACTCCPALITGPSYDCPKVPLWLQINRTLYKALRLPFSEIQNYAVLLHAKIQFQKTYRGISIQQRNIDKQGGTLTMGFKIEISKLKMLRIIKKYFCTGLRSQLFSNRTRSKARVEVPSNNSHFLLFIKEKKRKLLP